ncbi:uncharacterized protein LOC128389820 [Panonychus citri]|uniref:uncharacterized protein LOC128389820 n=1 Tax=Panonychus citri TaxID=50023 RepID=UPI0023070743|nr:uncharacterized protein LOC128389820 [Panonychus citri]
MAYHHFCVTLSSLSLSLAFLLHFSPTIYSNAEDLVQDESPQFKPHPRHHRYHSSLITYRPYHNQEDTQVAYLPILIILIVISLFLIVNCYKKESSPNIPDLTETSCLSAFISRACNSNEVTGHHSFLLPKVKTIHQPTSLIISPLTNHNNSNNNYV